MRYAREALLFRRTAQSDCFPASHCMGRVNRRHARKLCKPPPHSPSINIPVHFQRTFRRISNATPTEPHPSALLVLPVSSLPFADPLHRRPNPSLQRLRTLRVHAIHSTYSRFELGLNRRKRRRGGFLFAFSAAWQTPPASPSLLSAPSPPSPAPQSGSYSPRAQ